MTTAAKKPPARRSAWDIACEWYKVNEIELAIQHGRDEWRDRTPSQLVPKDVYSREFAVWLTDQYRLAMAKGIQIGRGQE